MFLIVRTCLPSAIPPAPLQSQRHSSSTAEAGGHEFPAGSSTQGESALGGGGELGREKYNFFSLGCKTNEKV